MSCMGSHMSEVAPLTVLNRQRIRNDKTITRHTTRTNNITFTGGCVFIGIYFIMSTYERCSISNTQRYVTLILVVSV
jgi:hypothetical protein